VHHFRVRPAETLSFGYHVRVGEPVPRGDAEVRSEIRCRGVTVDELGTHTSAALRAGESFPVHHSVETAPRGCEVRVSLRIRRPERGGIRDFDTIELGTF
jgi:hypothetical protein